MILLKLTILSFLSSNEARGLFIEPLVLQAIIINSL